jgi:hypothetical protein
MIDAERVGKAILLTLAAMLLAALGGFAAWFHAGEPPGCTDPRTLAMVRESVVRYHLPPSTQMVGIHTLAGGPLALRFVCQAQLIGIHKADLPPDTPIPGEITYTSRLTDHRTRHEVTVRIEPLLRWEKVQ